MRLQGCATRWAGVPISPQMTGRERPRVFPAGVCSRPGRIASSPRPSRVQSTETRSQRSISLLLRCLPGRRLHSRRCYLRHGRHSLYCRRETRGCGLTFVKVLQASAGDCWCHGDHPKGSMRDYTDRAAEWAFVCRMRSQRRRKQATCRPSSAPYSRHSCTGLWLPPTRRSPQSSHHRLKARSAVDPPPSPTIAVTSIAPDSDAQNKSLAFDPTTLADGIELSDDPLPALRSSVYALSAKHRHQK